MLDMGFIHDIKKIIAQVPKDRQSLFFSATMAPEIIELSRKIVRKFNAMYGTEITEPNYKLSKVGRLSGLDGNASSERAKSYGDVCRLLAERAWEIVQRPENI